MSTREPQAPSLHEFLETCRGVLNYLGAYGFKESPIPSYRAGNEYQIWFVADERAIVVTGEGWGTSASIALEHRSGVQLSEIYLVPQGERRGDRRRRTPGQGRTQLEQVRDAADRLRVFGVDFLRGDLKRFFELAKPLPPYLREPTRRLTAG
jgi:hypothetical protein